MKLKDFLESIAAPNFIGMLVEMTLAPKDSLTGGSELGPYLDQIKNCDEFKNCSLNLMDFPIIVHNGATLASQTMRLSENTTFRGDCFLYHVALSPVIYDPVSFEPFVGVMIRGCFNR